MRLVSIDKLIIVDGIRTTERGQAGRLLEDVKTVQGATDPETNDYRVLYPGYSTRTWNDKLYLYPLPTQELALNPQLTQNPGWE